MLKVYLEASCHAVLRTIFADGTPEYFQPVDDPGVADVIVFLEHEWHDIRRSELLRSYPSKCICISEWDKPSFFIPAVYASNESGWLAEGRAETTEYLITARHNWNEWVTKLASEPAEKKYLYSFIGTSTSNVRKHLLRHYAAIRATGAPSDFLIETTDRHASQHVAYDRRRYAEVMAASKYAICPRGWGTSSVRLFEACEMGVAPVILADRWVPLSGMDWTFAIFVEERRVRDLDQIVRSHETEWAERGRRARQAFIRHFSKEAAPRNLAERISRLMNGARPERDAAVRRAYPFIDLAIRFKARMRKWFASYRP